MATILYRLKSITREFFGKHKIEIVDDGVSQ